MKMQTIASYLTMSAMILLGTLAYGQASHAAPVTVTFTGTVTNKSGDFAGATGPVSGTFIYDSVAGDDLNGSASIGLYSFAGDPYGFSVQVDGFGSLDGTSTLVQVGDDGAVLPGSDTFQVAGTDGIYQSRIDWTGPTSTFSGDGIPDLSVILTMNPLFVITNFSSGQTELLASLDSLSVSAVPLPAAAWLLGSGLLALVGIRRKPGSRAPRHCL